MATPFRVRGANHTLRGGVYLRGSLATYEMTCSPGSYAVVGSPLTPLADRLLNMSAGSYAVNGSNASLHADRALSLASGSYTITGSSVEFIRQCNIYANAGTYTVSGANADLVGPYLLIAEAGVYVVDGKAASLLADRCIPLGAGGYTVTMSESALVPQWLPKSGGKLPTRPFLPKPPLERKRDEDIPDIADAVQELNSWARQFQDAVANGMWDTLAKNIVYIVSNAGHADFSATDTTIAVTFAGNEVDANYRTYLTPAWQTQCWISDKTTTGFTVHASTSPGGSGGAIDWVVVR